MNIVTAVFVLLSCFFQLNNSQAPTFVLFSIQGEFTGCWSTSGTLSTSTFISIGPVTAVAGSLLPSGLLLPLPADPTPNVISQSPNSLLIQMGTLKQVSRNQLCNGFSAPPFPGTSATAAPGQKAFSGFYGSVITVFGQQQVLPECVPPGIPGVICDPTKSQIILNSLSVIVAETVLSGFLTPTTDPRATFNINNVPCVPIIYNNPVTGFRIDPIVIDEFGFQVDPATLLSQGPVVATGWFSQIVGESLYYYYSTQVLAGTRLPNQLIGITVVKCVTKSGALDVRGGVTTALPGPRLASWGSVTLTDAFNNAAIATSIPKESGLLLPTASWVARANVFVCPKSIRVTWNIPPGVVLPPGVPTTIVVPTL